MSKSFNFIHPELQEGEIFLTNTNEGMSWCGWKTKRQGKIAYDIEGNPISHMGYVPIFVQRSELRAAGITKLSDGETV